MRKLLIILFLAISSIANSQLIPSIYSTFDDDQTNGRYYDIKEALKHPDDVKVLILQGLNLNELPHKIIELQNLEELYLGFVQGIGFIETNKLTVFPEEILELTKLKVLQLNYNEITEIPEGIKNLASLRSLELFGNPIKEFPTALYELPDLEYLDIGNTEIQSLPDDIYRLKTLRSLDLSYSKIKRLPESFGNLKKLEWLDLSMSDFQHLPSSLSNCDNIIHLDLFGTNDLNLGKAFEILKDIDSLKWINLNKIKELPQSIAEFKNLETLFINNDQYHIDYSQLFLTIAKISTLKHLLIYNEVEGDWIIPDEIGQCTQLETLELYHSNYYYEFTVSEEIEKLTKLKQFSHIEYIDNYKKIRKLLPADCYQH